MKTPARLQVLHEPRPGAVDLSAVLREIEDARLEAAERDLRRGAAH